jgi:hypothetical protein
MFPAPTGYVAELLGVLEPRLNGLVRRGKIDPRPPVVAGRRLWSLAHVCQAARHLGLLDDELEQKLREEVAGGCE